MKTGDFLPTPRNVELEAKLKEQRELMAARFELLHPGKVGKHWPAMHVPLLPGRSVRLPMLDKRMVEHLGLKTGPTASYDVDYFGLLDEVSLEYARSLGLVKFPAVFFSILGERKG